MIYRNKKLRDSARDEPCIACGRNDGTTVLAHSNEQQHGKGMGIKAHDLLALYLCQSCHNQWDGRSGDMSRVEKREFFRNHLPNQITRLAVKMAAGELKL